MLLYYVLLTYIDELHTFFIILNIRYRFEIDLWVFSAHHLGLHVCKVVAIFCQGKTLKYAICVPKALEESQIHLFPGYLQKKLLVLFEIMIALFFECCNHLREERVDIYQLIESFGSVRYRLAIFQDEHAFFG